MTDEEILALIRKEVKYALEKQAFELDKKIARLQRVMLVNNITPDNRWRSLNGNKRNIP